MTIVTTPGAGPPTAGPALQIGHFSLHPVGKLTGCKWRKDLWNAELTGTITTDKGEIRIRHFTHAVDMAIVTELTPTAGEQGCQLDLASAPRQGRRGGGYPTNESGHRRFAKQLRQPLRGDAEGLPSPIRRDGWKTTAEFPYGCRTFWPADSMRPPGASRSADETRTLIVSIANSYPESTAAGRRLRMSRRFLKLDRSRWVETHRNWWHDYYPRSFVSIPDKGLESLYWQTIYRFGCTSRAGRCFVDTPGIWFQGKSWPYFTTDWNIQSAHWPVYTANRLEQGQALVDRLHERREELIKAVRPVEWQEDSAYLPIAVAWDMIGTRDGDMRYYDLVGNLPWTMHNMWCQYRYSMDDAMLREKIYPLLRRAINLYLHMVKEGEDGKLHLPPTYSPESGVFADCNFDLALFKWGCHTLLKASRRLKIDDPLIPRWKAGGRTVFPTIPPMNTGSCSAATNILGQPPALLQPADDLSAPSGQHRAEGHRGCFETLLRPGALHRRPGSAAGHGAGPCRTHRCRHRPRGREPWTA